MSDYLINNYEICFENFNVIFKKDEEKNSICEIIQIMIVPRLVSVLLLLAERMDENMP